MRKTILVLIGGFGGAGIGVACVIGLIRVVCGFDEKGDRLFQLSMPSIVWAGLVAAIMGCTLGATWTADVMAEVSGPPE